MKEYPKDELPERIRETLASSGVTRYLDIVWLSKKEFQKSIFGLGDRGMEEVEYMLQKIGLFFGINLKQFRFGKHEKPICYT